MIAQKFGAEYVEDKKYFHSCGIMYINDSRVFYCVMTKDLNQSKAVVTAGYMINRIYYYVAITKQLLNEQN